MPVQGHDVVALHEIRQRGGNADDEDACHELARNPRVPDGNRQMPGFSENIADKQDIAQNIAEHRCQRGTAGPHSKREDEDGIQDDVQDTSGDACNHRLHGKALGPDDVARGKRQDDQRSAERNPEIVLRRILQRIRCCAENAQNRSLKCKHKHSNNQSADNCGIEAESAHVSCRLVILLPEQS